MNAMPLRPGRFAALLAILAMALQAFWPLLAQTKPGARTVLVQICTTDGATHQVEIAAGGDAPSGKRGAGHSSHCVLCLGSGDRALAVPPCAIAWLAFASFASERPLADAGARFVSSSHRFARSRAPPRSA